MNIQKLIEIALKLVDKYTASVCKEINKVHLEIHWHRNCKHGIKGRYGIVRCSLYGIRS